jgi:hypothetical protein
LLLYDMRCRSAFDSDLTSTLPVTFTETKQKHIYYAQSGPALQTTNSAPLPPPVYEESLLSHPITSYLESNLSELTTSHHIFLGVVALEEKDRSIFGWSVYHESKVWSDAGKLAGRHVTGVTTAFLGGMLAGLTLLQRVTISGTIYIRVITQTVADQLSTATPIGITHMTCQDFDLIQVVRAALNSLKDSCKVRLVLQDEQTNYDDALDTAKSEAMLKATHCQTCSSSFAIARGLSSISRVTIERQGLAVAGNCRHLVREDLYYESLNETIIKKEKWSINVFPMVAWEAFSKAFKRLSRPRQITYAKLTHSLLQTNSRNHLYYNSTPLCPGCKIQEETIQHVWSCHFPATVLARQELLDTYKTTLSEFPTPPQLIDVILHGIQQWMLIQNGDVRRQIAPTAADISLSAVMAAYTEQTTRIRWDAFLRGRVSLAWGPAYRAYFRDAMDEQIQIWLSDLIRANLDLSLAIWNFRNSIVHGANLAE